MPTRVEAAPNCLPRFAFVVLCVALAVMVTWANLTLAAAQARGPARNLPFGIFVLPNGTTVAQDFAYNLLFLEGVRDHVVGRPYRVENQEQLMRHMLPESRHGMTHAYSPVALILAQPFLALPGAYAFLLYTILSAAGVLLLYYFHFMPRMETRLQVYAFLTCMLSVGVISSLATGQTALITTALIGAIWSLLQLRPVNPSLRRDILIAGLFWAVCFKPSVALIPFALLAGEKAWRPLAITSLLLLATWVCAADFYGGWWTGLSDYFHLLNHYNNADFSPYLQRGLETGAQGRHDLLLFSLERGGVLAATALLIALRWTRHITPSRFFQGMVWTFLLLSPYLLGSELCIVTLLVVEGTFFHSRRPLIVAAKVLLLAALLDLRVGVSFPVETGYYLKWLLFLWIVVEAMQKKYRAMPATPRTATYHRFKATSSPSRRQPTAATESLPR